MTTMTVARGPQHLHALEQANKVRLARAALKRRVLQGDLTVAEVVLDVPWEAATMTIADLLLSQRRWGHTRCRKLLQTIPMSETKTLETMTDRQRKALATTLDRQARDARSARPSRAPLEPALALGG